MPTSIPSAPSIPVTGNTVPAKPGLVDAFASLFGSSAGGPALAASFDACLAPATGAPAQLNPSTTATILAALGGNILAAASDARVATVHSGDASTGKTSTIATAATTETDTSSSEAKPVLTLTRDQIETVAALLAPVLMSLQNPMPAAGPIADQNAPALTGFAQGKSGSKVPALSAAATAELAAVTTPTANATPVSMGGVEIAPDSASDSTGPTLVKATVSIDSITASISLPIPKAPPTFAEALATARQAVTAQATAQTTAQEAVSAQPALATDPTASTDQLSAISVTVQLPGLNAPTAPAKPTARLEGLISTDLKAARFASQPTAEKSAGPRPSASPRGDSTANGPEKHFVAPEDESLAKAKTNSGIGGAQATRIMTDSSTARRSPANVTDMVAGVHAAGVKAEAASSGASTANAQLAQRAVSTVLNVVNAQDNRPAASVVNLHFKFGADDLSVRVQMRGNEVHTQFNTDSSDLRSALASEWRGVASNNSGSGIRLADPVFATSNGSNQQLGSGAQGQSSQREFAQQQSAAQLIMPAAQAFTGENATSADAASQPTRMAPLHTSLHLAAVA
ncbi:MAG TPA: hypothetical protein VHD32_02350 [Candidatus Didemnitutus sp.]|nr:hypothetical protein [Candidatus Didemnitutus sp.]